MKLTNPFSPRTPVIAALVAIIMVTLAGTASAVPDYMWRNGHFTQAGAPVYAASVDGYWCHWFGNCRSEQRGPDDPGPIYRSHRAGETVAVECSLGAYYKLSQPRPGWVAQSQVRTTAKPVPCYAGDF